MNPDEISISIRKATAADVEEIERIHTLITNEDGHADFRQFLTDHVEEKDSESICFVAILEGKVVGFMIGHVMIFSFGLEKSGWIAIMGVEPQYMGQNIGARLANEIFEQFKEMGVNNVYIPVQWDATDMVSFFKKLGFQRSEFINLERPL